MTKPTELLKGYEKFFDEYFVSSPELYRHLATEGQSPKTLVIACSDSRVDPSIVFKAAPGDIFVIRNVANLVPPFEKDFVHCHGTSAAIEYAVEYLKVENIVVLGHSNCGGIKALVDGHERKPNFIDPWLDVVQEAKLSCLKVPEKKYCSCEKAAIKISLENLKTFPFITKRIKENKLELYGWYFCLENGKLEEIGKF